MNYENKSSLFSAIWGKASQNAQKNSLPGRKPQQAVSYSAIASDCTFNLVGTQASCTDINMARGTVNNRLHALDIRLPGSVGTSVGVGYFDTKADTFSAEITFGHNGTSFDLQKVNVHILSNIF